MASTIGSRVFDGSAAAMLVSASEVRSCSIARVAPASLSAGTASSSLRPCGA
jgi:hypothetical protein